MLSRRQVYRLMETTHNVSRQARESEEPRALQASAASQRWIRIIPVALVMYTIAFIDRTNISLALPRISRDLHLDPQQAGVVRLCAMI
jgi:sugar phosphate permease